MKDYQKEFVRFLVETGALRFGSFTLKSGRQSPYYFNSALFDTAATLERLGYFYACAIQDLDEAPTVVFGPAYKGVPLAVAASIALKSHFKIDTAYCFDRKEAKTHGDKGLLVGRTPAATDRIAIVDDVITDGLTKVESIERLREVSEASICGLVIALDRQEKTLEGKDPIASLAERCNVQVRAIATLDQVIAALSEEGGEVFDAKTRESVEAYRREYGV